MSETAAALIVTCDPAVAALADSLRADGINCSLARDLLSAQEQMESAQPRVALLDADLPRDESFQIYRLLHVTHQVPTLMLVPAESYWQFALDPRRLIADDYVSKPAKLEELTFRLKAMMLQAGYEVPSPHVPSTGAVDGGQRVAIREGEIVCVFSMKGGVGKSTLSVNLGVGLTSLAGASALVVDADLWFGDVGILLNLASRKSLSDLCGPEEPDALALREALVDHDSGTSVLLRPWDVTAVEQLNTSRIARILQMYKTMFDYVIVDMEPAIDDMNLQIMDVADRILLVITPEISAAANTCRFMQIAEILGYNSKISIVLNRANFGLGMEQIQAGLGVEVAGRIVSAGPAVVNAATKGMSLFQLDPDHKEQITQDMARIVELVSGKQLEQPKARQKKWLGLRRG